MKALHKVLAAALCAGLSAGTLFAQSSSGTISGRLLDPSGQSIPGATITLIRTDTREVRRLVTPPSGDIVFASLQPGPYRITVEVPGFKALEKTGMELSASERLSIGNLVLQVGAQSETITVKAEIAPVQTASSERGALVDYRQVAQLPTRGRDIYGLMPTLPGVVYDGRGNDGIEQATNPAAFSGVRGQYTTANIDGISGTPRSGNQLDTTIGMDTVAEVKVLLNNYQAEYGKGAAGVINIVSKSGTQEFHGSAYYYGRNEKLNANEFFKNKDNQERGRYRYNTVGGTWGGPLYLPGVLNKEKDKLFFFGAYEYRPSTTQNAPRYYTVPTLAERNGDFSRSVGSKSGALYSPDKIIDPLTGKAFPGGIIPKERIDPNMQRLLNLFPLPNAPDVIHGGAKDPSGNWYNFTIAGEQQRPSWQGSLRLDYNISDKVHAFVRASNYKTHNKGLTSAVNRHGWMEGADIDYVRGGRNWGGTLTWIASPTLVAEVIGGYASWVEEQTYPEDFLVRMQRDKVGFTLPQIYPAQNPLNVVPSIQFGSLNVGNNPATIRWEGRFPMETIADAWTASANVTKIWNAHQFKTGVAFERTRYFFKQGGQSDSWSGRFDFDADKNPVNNTTHPYANALLGYFNRYVESTNRTPTEPVTPILEFYTQDTWKTSPRLTLDIGVRVTVGLPQQQRTSFGDGRYAASSFLAERFDASKAPLLYQPVLDKNGKPAVVDPRNPTAYLPIAYYGQLVPGSGDTLNGVVVSGDPGYPRALVDFQGVMAAPRLGFAWDVFGDGSTAVRGGFGLNFNPRAGNGLMGDQKTNPPMVYEPTVYFGNTSTYRDATGLTTPAGFARVFNRSNPKARVAHTSLGVQRRLPLNMVLDVAYVGTFGRHIGTQTPLNDVPDGARFDPANWDPTAKLGTPLKDDYLRPYRGYAGIPYLSYDANSSYHGLQTSLQRRFSNGFQLGIVYTWSKAMDYSNGENGTSRIEDRKKWDYGLSDYDRTHVFAANYLLSLPGEKLNNGFLRNVVGGWQISGITRFQSGAPLGLSPTLKTGCTQGAATCVQNSSMYGSGDITGGSTAFRAVQTGNPTLPRKDRTVDHWFDTSVFAPPALAQTVTDLAGVQRVRAAENVGRRIGRGPGISNTDLALFKNFKVKGDVTLQFRAEAYNVFNHTQFETVNVAPQWDQSGVQTNPSFGKVTAARDPRILQLAVQLKF